MDPASNHKSNTIWTPVAICIFLALAVWAVFGQTIHDEFINYDDDLYIYKNPVVIHGLDIDKIAWVFTHDTGPDEWYPLTSISHMLDWQLFGPRAGGHHGVNVLLHAATAILLFLTLRKMTGTTWRSAFVAAVFAIHPLRVESVAWVMERKDVLSGLFFMLTLWTWTRYVQSHAEKEAQATAFDPSRWTADYYFALAFFIFSLLSKSTAVTLPLVLLLLDYWPFNRLSSFKTEPVHSALALLFEKAPFVLVSAAACVVTVLSQPDVMTSVQGLSPGWRLSNALVAYSDYIGHMFYPAHLALLYSPPDRHLTFLMVAFPAAMVLFISVAVILCGRKYPYLPVGWFWYLVMFLPVIDIMQAGFQARADRYTYLPQIGLYLMITWGAVVLCDASRSRKMVLAVVAGLVLVALSADAYVQTGYWKNNITLWTHTLARTPDSYIAHCNLGIALADEGQLDAATTNFHEALQLNPDDAKSLNNLGKVYTSEGKLDDAIRLFNHALQFKTNDVDVLNNLGVALANQGKVDDAIQDLQQIIQLNPDYADAYYNLGNILMKRGDLDDAIQNYEQALQINPDLAEAHCNLGLALARQGKLDDAIAHYQQAIEIKPQYVDALDNLGGALTAQGKSDEAAQYYERAIELRPNDPDALSNLGVALARLKKFDEAVQDFGRALKLRPDDPSIHNNLAITLANQGKMDAAIQEFQTALSLARAQNKTALEDSIISRLNHYQAQSLLPGGGSN
jgi:tetratricopeptide (TPR) repeat protein